MSNKTSQRQLASRARAVTELLGTKPPVNLAFNFINFQNYKYKFIANNVRHPTQVFVLDKFLLLSQIFIINHGTNWFYHSHSQLQKSLGMSSKTVKKVTDILVERKILRKRKAGRTGKLHYKIQYAALMSQYRGFLDPNLLEDEVTLKRVYIERLRYFAYMAKFSRALESKPTSSKPQKQPVYQLESSELPKPPSYSTNVKQFIANELDDEHDYESDDSDMDDDMDEDEAYIPAPPKRFSTTEDKFKYLKLTHPDVSDAEIMRLLKGK
ncbi:MAG: hypothetical protein ACRYFX_31375 [Janthinobacterium lividum]